MAENHEKQPKTFRIAYGKRGDKKNIYAGFYSRIRQVRDGDGQKLVNDDQNVGGQEPINKGVDGQKKLIPVKSWTATDERRVLFGLWSKKEEYVWSGRQEQDVVFRRSHKTESNGFRRKNVEYYENGAVKEVSRRNLGGLYHSASELDADGEELSHTTGDFIGLVKHSRSRDGRNSYYEHNDLFGLFGTKQEALRLPDGTTVGWRTVQRRIGSYKMDVVPDENGKGETRSRSFGALFERSTHYNFHTGEKTTNYKIPLLRRERENKPRRITTKEMQRHDERREQKAAARAEWNRAAVGLREGSEKSPQDYIERFEQALTSRTAVTGADKNFEIASWLVGTIDPPFNANKQTTISASFTKRQARFDDTYALEPGDSISEPGAPVLGRGGSAAATGKIARKGPPTSIAGSSVASDESGGSSTSSTSSTSSASTAPETQKKGVATAKPTASIARAPALIADSSVANGEAGGSSASSGWSTAPSTKKEDVATARPPSRADVAQKPNPVASMTPEQPAAPSTPKMNFKLIVPVKRVGVISRPLPVASSARKQTDTVAAAPSVADSSVAGNYSTRPGDRDRRNSFQL